MNCIDQNTIKTSHLLQVLTKIKTNEYIGLVRRLYRYYRSYWDMIDGLKTLFFDEPLKADGSYNIGNFFNYYYMGSLYLGTTAVKQEFIFDTGSSVIFDKLKFFSGWSYVLLGVEPASDRHTIHTLACLIQKHLLL
jgi:hypothetical protein